MDNSADEIIEMIRFSGASVSGAEGGMLGVKDPASRNQLDELLRITSIMVSRSKETLPCDQTIDQFTAAKKHCSVCCAFPCCGTSTYQLISDMNGGLRVQSQCQTTN